MNDLEKDLKNENRLYLSSLALLLLSIVIASLVGIFGNPKNYNFYDISYLNVSEQEFLTNDYNHIPYFETETKSGVTLTYLGDGYFSAVGVGTFSNNRFPLSIQLNNNYGDYRLYYNYVEGTISGDGSGIDFFRTGYSSAWLTRNAFQYQYRYNTSVVASFTNNFVLNIKFSNVTYNLTFRLRLMPETPVNLGGYEYSFSSPKLTVKTDSVLNTSFKITEFYDLNTFETYKLNLSYYSGYFEGAVLLNLRSDTVIYKTISINDTNYYSTLNVEKLGWQNTYLEIELQNFNSNNAEFLISFDRISLEEEIRFGNSAINIFENLNTIVTEFATKVINLFNKVFGWFFDYLSWVLDKFIYFFGFKWLPF